MDHIGIDVHKKESQICMPAMLALQITASALDLVMTVTRGRMVGA